MDGPWIPVDAWLEAADDDYLADREVTRQRQGESELEAQRPLSLDDDPGPTSDRT